MKVIVDTNILMELDFDYKKYETVYIPLVVLEELDHLKTNRDFARAYQAKVAIRKIRDAENKIIKLSHNAVTSAEFDSSVVDNKILDFVASCISLGECDVFLTNDINMQIKAESVGIPVLNLLENNCDIYKGYKEVVMDDADLAEFYQEKINDFGLLENEYLIIKNKKDEIIDKYRWTEQKGFLNLSYKNLDGSFMGKLKPRNLQQEIAFDLLQNKNIPVKVLYGVFGSGKDLLMASHAINYIQSKRMFDKLMFVRSNTGVKNVGDIGFLPGSEFDKLLPYAMPLADHVGGIEGIKMLVMNNTLSLQHLGFIRGRDIKNTIVIVSEAENLTKDHAQLLISRIGEGSQIWFNGDFKQIDSCVFEQDNGLRAVIDSLKGNELFGCVNFNITERSEVARLSDKF